MRGELVDTRDDPHASAARRRARLSRLAFPFVTAVLLVAAIVAITIYTERVNRRDALKLTAGIVSAVQNSVRREVQAYLAPPAATVTALADGAMAMAVIGEPAADRALERTLRRALLRHPELTAVFAGDAEGDFVMVQRDGDRLRTKLVAANGENRVVRWLVRGRGGAIEEERFDPEDAFDPRERPWFRSAEAGVGVHWSDVYRFFSTGALGITVSIRVPEAPDLPTTVVGADLEIAAIGDFLGTLDLGAGGRAFILEPDGDVVAYPPSLVRAAEAAEAAPTVGSFVDPVVNEAFQRFRVERRRDGVVHIDGRRYLVASSSLAEVVDREWWLLLIVPEENFIGFVGANARRSLALSGFVVLLATLAAGLLTYQGLQSDARAQRAVEAEAAVRERDRTLDRLAAIRGLADPGDDAALERYAAIVAEATAARRVTIWRRDAAEAALVCLESFDREVNAHTAAATLRPDHLGAAWAKLVAGERATVALAGHDDWQAIRDLYMAAVGVERLEIVPIRSAGRLLGQLWLEDVAPGPAVVGRDSALDLLARLLAPRLLALASADAAGALGVADAATEPSLLASPAAHAAPLGVARRGSISRERDRALLRRLAESGGQASLGAALFPRVAVLHLRLGDATALAQAGAEAEIRLADLVTAAREVAATHRVPYLQLLGDTIVAAAGFDADNGDVAAVRAVAEVALGLQPACREASRRSRGRAGFRFGLDIGPAFGAGLGFDDRPFNLWGEACRLAERLADSAPATAIQVSEAAYDRLRVDYLLRRRGSYYVEGVGEMSTFLLAGRL